MHLHWCTVNNAAGMHQMQLHWGIVKMLLVCIICRCTVAQLTMLLVCIICSWHCCTVNNAASMHHIQLALVHS